MKHYKSVLKSYIHLLVDSCTVSKELSEFFTKRSHRIFEGENMSKLKARCQTAFSLN